MGPIHSPEFQGSLTLAYDTPVSDSLSLTGAVSARYQSKSNTIFEDLDLYKVKAYGTVNASLGVKSESGWSVSSTT